MQIRSFAFFVALAAWLAHAAGADEPAAAPQGGDALRAAAEAHSRAKAQRRKELDAARAQTQARLDAALQKNDAGRQAALQAQAARLQEAAGVQAKTYLEPFRERLELELHFIEKACGLSHEESAAVGKHCAEIAERAQSVLAKALAEQAAHHRRAVVVFNGNVLAVPEGASGQYITDPAKAASEELERSAIALLADGARAKLAEARRQQNDRAAAAARWAALALLDEELMLSRAQCKTISELLESVWRTPLDWGQNPMLVSRYAAEMLHQVHLLLPHERLLPLLRPVQQAAWKSLSESVSKAPSVGPRRILDRQAFVVQLMADDGRLNVKLRDASDTVKPVRTGSASESIDYVELAIDNVAAECELSAEQRIKLQLAAKLDTKRTREHAADAVTGHSADDADANARGALRVKNQGAVVADRVVLSPSILVVDRSSVLLAGPKSAFERLLQSRLSADQIRQLSEARHARRMLHERAAIAAVLQAFDARVMLTAEQHERLTGFFEQRLAAAPDGTSAGLRAAALVRLSEISMRNFSTMLDDVQRPVAMNFWRELCAAIAPEREHPR